MPEQVEQKIDIRLYIGLLFFYWQTIAVFFLWSLLAGVVYIQFAAKQYETSCKLMISRDINLEVKGTESRYSPWRSQKIHSFFLSGEELRREVAEELLEEWGERMGSMQKMMLPVDVVTSRAVGSTLDVNVRSRLPGYAEAYLKRIIEKHSDRWYDIQAVGSRRAYEMLKKELENLSEEIDQAEDDLIEYQRLNDIARVEASASMESQYLSALMSRKSMLTTELMLLESQYPLLKNANASVISDVARLTKETGDIEPPEVDEVRERKDDAGGTTREIIRSKRIELPDELAKDSMHDDRSAEKGATWRNLQIKRLQYEQEEKKLLMDLEANHPRIRSLREKINELTTRLELAATTEMRRLRDRHKALMIQRDAVERAIYQWQAKNLLSSKRRSELKRYSGVLVRYQRNYDALYARLNDMRIKEALKADHFRILQEVKTNATPVWPDPLKILMVTLVVGFGLGFGLAIIGHTLNNKIQTINDVEKELNVPFLGGVPYWVRSGLEQTARPIVTEEFSTGATEAYRSLRTTLLNLLAEINEKIVIVTSADSREGKTLTTLNLAIMIAQMEGKKVLLVDMDLRRGRLHRSMGIEKEPGMTGVLEGRHKLADVIVATRFDGLSMAPAGKSIDNSAELLQTRDMKALLAEVEDDFDYIMIDSSPVLRVTDTVILASQNVGAVLYIARVNKTPKPMIKYSLGLLEGARVLGLIMNSIEMHRVSSLYYAYQYPAYAYYSNAYAYGYDYYDDKGGKGKGRPRKKRSVSIRRRWHSFEKWAKRTFLPME